MPEIIYTNPLCGGCATELQPDFVFRVVDAVDIDLATLEVTFNAVSIVSAGVPAGGWGLASVALSGTLYSGYTVTLSPPAAFDPGDELCFTIEVDNLSGDPLDANLLTCAVDIYTCCFNIHKPSGVCVPVISCAPDEPPPDPIADPALPLLQPVGFVCGQRSLEPCAEREFVLRTPNAALLRGLQMVLWADGKKVYKNGANILPAKWIINVTPDPTVTFENLTYLVEFIPVPLPWESREYEFLFSISDLAGTVSSAFQSCTIHFAQSAGYIKVIQNLSCAPVVIDGVTIPAKIEGEDGSCIGGFIPFQNLPSLERFIAIGCVSTPYRLNDFSC